MVSQEAVIRFAWSSLFGGTAIAACETWGYDWLPKHMLQYALGALTGAAGMYGGARVVPTYFGWK